MNSHIKNNLNLTLVTLGCLLDSMPFCSLTFLSFRVPTSSLLFSQMIFDIRNFQSAIYFNHRYTLLFVFSGSEKKLGTVLSTEHLL